jgi:iron complex outermembrane receptor protein
MMPLPGAARIRARVWIGALAAGAQLLPCTAQAQQGAQVDQLAEVVVTARKRVEPLQSVPVAVSVLGGNALSQRDLRSAIDLTASIPNLQTPLNPVLFSAPTFFIRGVGEGDHNWNTENGVAVLVDDVYLQSTAGAWVEFVDLERVEVLRGPQGTLYGRNSTSGAIRFVPRQAEPGSASGRAELTFGSRSRLDARFGLNMPVVAGRAAIRFDAFRSADDGDYTRVDSANRDLDGRISQREHVGGRIASLWRPNDALECELNLDWVWQHNGMHLVTPIVPADPAAATDLHQLLSKRGTVSFVPLYGVNRGALEPLTIGGDSGQSGGGMVFKTTFDSMVGRLRSITAWRRNDEHFMSQLGGRDTPATLFGVTLYGNVDTLFENVSQLTQELQLASSTARQVSYTAGLYYFHSRWAESEYGATNGVPANLSPYMMPGQTQSFGGSYNDVDQTTDSWALYASLDWHVRPQLTLSLGARQTWDRKQLHFDTLFEDHLHSYPGFPLATGHDWHRFTPHIGLDWRPSEAALLYLSYAQGYKAGNVEGARSSDSATAAHWLAPELASSVEAGLKADWLQRRLRTNLAVFVSDHSNRTDLISPDRVATADVRYRGLELELSARPYPAVELNANLGLLQARYRAASANHPAFAPDPSGYAPGLNAQPPMSPRYTLNLGVVHTATLRSGRSLGTTATVRAVGRHYHALGVNNYDSEIVAPYAVLDASTTLARVPAHLQLTLGAHNLLNRTYYVNGLFGAIPEFAGRYYADGRTLYLSLKSNW